MSPWIKSVLPILLLVSCCGKEITDHPNTATDTIPAMHSATPSRAQTIDSSKSGLLPQRTSNWGKNARLLDERGFVQQQRQDYWRDASLKAMHKGYRR